jgi:hypothetical protein
MIESDGFHEAPGTDYSAVTEIPDTVQQLTDEVEIAVLLPWAECFGTPLLYAWFDACLGRWEDSSTLSIIEETSAVVFESLGWFEA